MKPNLSNLPKMEFLWTDTKRWLGMPLTFTHYKLSEDRLFLERGLLNHRSDEILLYRVRDLSVRISFGQRILGVGTVCVVSSDKNLPHMDMINIKFPNEVKELVHQQVEKAKEKRRMHSMELMDDGNYDAGDISHGDLDEFED